MRNIGIIGCGTLGMRIAEECLRANIFSNIDLENRSKKRRDGVTLSLNILGNIENYASNVGLFDWNSIERYEIIVIAIKDDYDPRLIDIDEYVQGLPVDLRYAGVKHDIGMFVSICKRLGDFTGKVVVVSNPVDLFTAIAGRIIGGATVCGLGLGLDSARIMYALGSQCRSLRREVLQIPMVGPHGPEAWPLESSSEWSLLSRQIDALGLSKAVEEGLRLGYEIVDRLGFTLHDCSAVFRRDIVWLAGCRETASFRNISLALDGSCVGAPWSVSESDSFYIRDDYGPEYRRLAKSCLRRFDRECEVAFEWVYESERVLAI